MSFTYTIDNSGGNNDSGSDSNSVSTAGKWTIDSHTVTTPVLLVPSYIGNQLYSTPDNNNYISNRSLDPTANENSTQLVQIEIADFVQKDFNDVPLAKLYKQWNNNQVNVLSIRSTKYKTAMSSTNGISIDTVGGRKVISVDDYLKRILIDQPPVVIAFADEVIGNLQLLWLLPLQLMLLSLLMFLCWSYAHIQCNSR